MNKDRRVGARDKECGVGEAGGEFALDMTGKNLMSKLYKEK